MNLATINHGELLITSKGKSSKQTRSPNVLNVIEDNEKAQRRPYKDAGSSEFSPFLQATLTFSLNSPIPLPFVPPYTSCHHHKLISPATMNRGRTPLDWSRILSPLLCVLTKRKYWEAWVQCSFHYWVFLLFFFFGIFHFLWQFEVGNVVKACKSFGKMTLEMLLEFGDFSIFYYSHKLY